MSTHEGDQEEKKKDLTGIIELSQALHESGQAPPIPEGSVMEEAPIEKVESFESLEDYAVTHPPTETLPTESASPSSEFSTELSPEFSNSDFQSSSESDSSAESGLDSGSALDSGPGSVSAPEFETTPESNLESNPDFAISAPEQINSSDFAITPESSSSSDFPLSMDSTESPTSSETSSDFQSEIKTESITPSFEARSPHAKATRTPVEKIKDFAEKMPIGKPSVSAAFPFSLLITGTLLIEEKEKLLDLLSRENMGIREIDLEPQFASGRILIPRISEYAGILIVQALRETHAQIKFGPSDTIFSKEDSQTETTPLSTETDQKTESYSTEISHPAELIPVTSGENLPGQSDYTLIDTVSANAALKSHAVEADSSAEYQEMIEALQREIKYKAFRKGATGIIHFKIQLDSLSSPTHYRMIAFGSAIKTNESSQVNK